MKPERLRQRVLTELVGAHPTALPLPPATQHPLLRRVLAGLLGVKLPHQSQPPATPTTQRRTSSGSKPRGGSPTRTASRVSGGSVPLPVLSMYRADGLTRRISAATYLDEHLPSTIVPLYAEDGLQASGPALGVNLTAVTRHARRAERWAARFDRMMALLMTGIALAGVGALGTLVVGARGMTGTLLAAFAAELVAAWALTLHARLRAVRAARSVLLGRGAPEDLVPPLAPETEDWLRSLRRSNVVVYATDGDPFVGSGECVHLSVWPSIDISQPARSASGQTLPIRPFDAVDLHTYMARKLPQVAGRAGLRARNRLYVRGVNAGQLGPDLLPDKLRRPLSRIPESLVQRGLAHPAAGMRTYLCLEMVGLDDRMIVSMFLRALLDGQRLQWEVSAYVLPPLQDRLYQVDLLPTTGFARWRNAAVHAARRAWPALLQAPGRTVARPRDSVIRGRRLQRARRDIAKGHLPYDYGARSSLRELFSAIGAMTLTDRIQAVETLRHLQATILTATKTFLVEHNVDIGNFPEPPQIAGDRLVDDLRQAQAAGSEGRGSEITDT